MLYFTLLSNLLNNQCGTLCHASFEHQEGEMYFFILKYLARFSSVAQSCLTLCKPMDCSTSGFCVHFHLPELLKPMSIKSVMPSNHPLSPPSPPTFNLS